MLLLVIVVLALAVDARRLAPTGAGFAAAGTPRWTQRLRFRLEQATRTPAGVRGWAGGPPTRRRRSR